MDPVSAVSLAANVCQFVDYACRIVSKGNKLRDAKHGLLVEDADLLAASSRVIELNNKLIDSLNAYNRSQRGILDVAASIQIDAACQGMNKVATELVDTLNKLRLPAGSGRWRSMRQALKAARGAQGVEKMKNDIMVYQQQLNTALLTSIYARLDPSFEFQTSTRSATGQPAPLLSQESVDLLFANRQLPPPTWQTRLMDKVLVTNRHSSVAMQVAIFRDELSSITEETTTKRAQQQLIELLSFPDLHDRAYRITTAHLDTFQWIFSGPDDRHPHKWRLFTPWLEGQEKIYWITGKPGSGKSTLMKFLNNSQQTTTHLRVWAGHLPLVQATFYFWNSGSQQQMSLDGLYRSVVYEILKEVPHLVPAAFPSRWKNHILFGQDLRGWNPQEIHQAFRVLLAKSGHAYRLCLFIDGLDECSEPHDLFVEELLSITQQHHVKLCLASRPWPVFETAFSTGAHLMLQDLTFPDIVRYTWRCLSSHRGFRALVASAETYAGNLVLDIAQKSSGVFLWVGLVVKSLLQGFTNADRMSDLHRRLEDIPEDLEALYLKMFESIEPFYHQNASRYFQISLAFPGQISALMFYFADEEDPSLAFTAPVKPLTEAEKLSNYRAIKTRLMACCKGIFEIPSSGKATVSSGDTDTEGAENVFAIEDGFAKLSLDEDEQSDQTQKGVSDAPDGETSPPDRRVTYLHRTAKDFFESTVMRQKIFDLSSDDYDPYCSVFCAALLVLKSLSVHSLKTEEVWQVIELCLRIAEASESVAKRALTKQLDELEKTAAQLFRESRLHKEDTDWTTTRWKSPVDNSSRGVGFLALTAEWNLKQYILSKFKEGIPRFAFAANRPNLDYIISGFAECPGLCEHPYRGGRATGVEECLLPNRQIIRSLLEHGEDPNEAFGEDLTPWIQVFNQATKCVGDKDLTRTQNISMLSHWADIADIFIRHDADPLVNGQSAIYSRVRETFGVLLPDRAKAMEKKLRRTRNHWSSIRRFIVPRNSKLVELHIESTPLPRLKTLDSAHPPSLWGDRFRPGCERPENKSYPSRYDLEAQYYPYSSSQTTRTTPFLERHLRDYLVMEALNYQIGKPKKTTVVPQPINKHTAEIQSGVSTNIPRAIQPYFEETYVQEMDTDQHESTISSDTERKDRSHADSEDANSEC